MTAARTIDEARFGLLDGAALWLLAGVLGVLVISTLASWILTRTLSADRHGALLTNLRQRIYAWWIMIAALFGALAVGETATIVMFAILSLLALREFRALSADSHPQPRMLTSVIIATTLIHYALVWKHWYGFFAVFIPVYVFLFLPAGTALRGRVDGFLGRTAFTQWSLMLSVFALSFAPATLNLPAAMALGREASDGVPIGTGGPDGARLLLFLVVVVQGSDVFQYIWGKLLGRHPIAPSVSPNKTWEGFIGGVLSATALGAGLAWITPFSPGQAAAMAFTSCLMGFIGGLVMSSIKRDRDIKDFGALIPGHGGIMDRLDSLVFAAPVFFHLVRYFFT